MGQIQTWYYREEILWVSLKVIYIYTGPGIKCGLPIITKTW